MYFSWKRKVYESSTTSNIKKPQMKTFFYQNFLVFLITAPASWREKFLLWCLSESKAFDIFISMKSEDFCIVLLPVAVVYNMSKEVLPTRKRFVPSWGCMIIAKSKCSLWASRRNCYLFSINTLDSLNFPALVCRTRGGSVGHWIPLGLRTVILWLELFQCNFA